jgi:zinc transport system ATP-binding protein
MTPLIDFENVSFSYDETVVLSDISFSIFSGEFIGIIGPNGGGKTTLLKLILGFIQPSKGKIHVLNHSPRSKTTRRHLAYVPQSMRYDREFPISVEEVVLSGLLSKLPWYGKFRQDQQLAALKALDEVGMESFCKHPFGQLSGGQAQRVLIARALVAEPQILLLDEPTASVDSQAEAEIYAILNKLQGKMTILMVTHDLRAAVNQVSRLLCVQRSVFSLKPEEVCEHYAIGLYHDPLFQIRQVTL